MAATPGARGVILRAGITDPSNYRSAKHLDAWLKARGIIGIAGIDTRALTATDPQARACRMQSSHIRKAAGSICTASRKKRANGPVLKAWTLCRWVTSAQRFNWDETPWEWGKGFGIQDKPEFNVVAIDYGIKRNILRLLAGEGCKVTVVTAKNLCRRDILAMKPDGVFPGRTAPAIRRRPANTPFPSSRR